MNTLKTILIVFFLSLVCSLLADNEADSIAAYSIYWKTVGSNAVIDSVFTINVLDIPDEITYELEGVDTPIPEAQPGEGFDNSLTFNELIKWINSNVDSVLVHTQIYIPPGVYNFSDQIVMGSNISLKGAGSHQTELRFLIRADSTSTSMSTSDCRKDAILISGCKYQVNDFQRVDR
jgi:hypothetical protein